MVFTNNKIVEEIRFGEEYIEFGFQGETLVYEKIFTKRLREGIIIFYDIENDIKKAAKPTKLVKIDLNRYIPIGIIVTPLNSNEHLMMSLPLMQCNNPTTGSIDKFDSMSNRVDMNWGPSITISKVPNIKTAEEALSDFNGETYTKALIETRGVKDYSTWKPNDLTGSIDYPAPSCCDIFYTLGTNQQEWYLPSCGELYYLTTGFVNINNSLQALIDNDIFVCTIDDDSYWSSNDYGGLYAWKYTPMTGNIEYKNKVTNGYKVRAVHKISVSEIN